MHELRLLLSIETKRTKRALLKLLPLAVLVALFEVGAIALVVPLLALTGNSDAWQRIAPHLPLLSGADLGARQILAILIAALFATYALKTGLQIFYYRRQTKHVAQSQSELAARLLQDYMLAPYSLIIQRHSAEFIRTITSLVQEVYGHFLNAVLTVAADLAAAIALVTLSLVIAPGATLAAGLLIVAIHVTQQRILRHTHVRVGGEHAEIMRRELVVLQQSLDAFREARVLGRERYFVDEFERIQQDLKKNVARFEFIRRLPIAIGEMAIVVSITAAVFVFLITAQQLSDLIVSLGLLAAVAFRLSPIANRLVISVGTIHHARPALEIIAAELTTFARRGEGARAPARATSFRTAIELRNVSHRYEGREQPVLDNVTLGIRRGEAVGIVGPSGAGKSTLVDIVLGLLRPTGGQLLIDGAAATPDTRLNAGYVPQKVLLFDDTVLRNVAFGLPDSSIDHAQMDRVIKLAGLSGLVARLPNGLLTTLGEDGRFLSGGERQRIGIARALYGLPDLIVMDEPTSALDAETEATVTASISSLRGTVTLIIISHRPATMRVCDRIAVLNAGRLVDFGSFEELRNRSPQFRQMLIATSDNDVPGADDATATQHRHLQR